jgi:hypothetical protein
MKKVGLKLSINMDKIDKSKIFKGKKGNYLDLTTFVSLEEADEYGQNGIIKQSADKGVDMPILGGVKIFWEGN